MDDDFVSLAAAYYPYSVVIQAADTASLNILPNVGEIFGEDGMPTYACRDPGGRWTACPVVYSEDKKSRRFFFADERDAVLFKLWFG